MQDETMKIAKRKINTKWNLFFSNEEDKEYYKTLKNYIDESYNTKTIFPKMENIFSAFAYNPNDIKVIIIGQDPYHEVGQAHGLSFSVEVGTKIPKSLVNIYKELQDDIGCYIPNNGCLTRWAEQGVFLLNSVLTVEEHRANSHKDIGWTTFTKNVIKYVDRLPQPKVYILWGNQAKKTFEDCELKNNDNRLVLCSAHPSPLSAYNGFFGSKSFSKTNEFLKSHNVMPIDWQIKNV